MPKIYRSNTTGQRQTGRLTLKQALSSRGFDPASLNPTNKAHLALLRGRALDDLLAAAPSREERGAIVCRYEERMAFLVRGCYELILAEEATRFSDFWAGAKGQVHLRILTRYLFEHKLGLKIEESGRIIDPRLFRANQKKFLADQGVDDWPELFRKHRLNGLMQKALVVPQSIVELFQKTYPWMFDYSTPEGEHLHLIDFARLPKTDEAEERRLKTAELKHVLEGHFGFKMFEAERDIDPNLTPAGQKTFLASHGISRWIDLLAKDGATGLVRGVYRDSFFLALRDAYPWVFDLSAPEGRHLHPWDFSPQGFYRAKETRVAAVRHLFEAHLGLTVEPGRISVELTTREGVRKILKREAVPGWHDLFRKHGLIDLLYSFNVAEESQSQAVAALREAYPFAFDLNSPEGAHCHFWLFRTKWSGETGEAAVREAGRHVLGRHRGLVDEETRTFDRKLASPKFTGSWKNLMTDEGLGGMFVVLYHGSPKEYLTAVYPWLFDLESEEGRHLHSWRLVSADKWRDAVSDELIRTGLRHIAQKHLGLKLERKTLRKKITRRLLIAEGFSKRMLRQKFQCSMVEVFRLAFPELFPNDRPFQDWLEYFRTEEVRWPKIPIQIKKWFLAILAAELDKERDMLTTADLQTCLPVFGEKNLLGLLRSYRRPEMGDAAALVELKADLGIVSEVRSFGFWLKQFQSGDIRWAGVPPQVQAQFVVHLAKLRGKHFLVLGPTDFWQKEALWNGKSLGGMLSHYSKTGENYELALIRIVRFMLTGRREETLAVKEDERLRLKLAERGAVALLSLDKRIRNRFINAYLDPNYFELDERKQLAARLVLSCQKGVNPLAIADDEYRQDISNCLIMLGYLADASMVQSPAL